jgi:hypothetical protein
MSAKFKLRCVGCCMVEERDADDCREQPFCNKCYMPMVLEKVTVKEPMDRHPAERLPTSHGASDKPEGKGQG